MRPRALAAAWLLGSLTCVGLLAASALVLRYDLQLWRRPPGGSGSHADAVAVLVLAVGLFLTAAVTLGLLIFVTALRSTRLRRWARRSRP